MSKHFKDEEFACSHCGEVKVSSELIILLELIRLRFGVPITITSGYRCEEHNKAIGGANNSYHVQGTAADIKVKGVSPQEVYNYINEVFPDSLGLGLYSSWVHVDVRQTRKGRW